MIKAKDEYNEWKEQRDLKIDGAVLFAGWLSGRYGLSEVGLHGNIEKWKEQLK